MTCLVLVFTADAGSLARSTETAPALADLDRALAVKDFVTLETAIKVINPATQAKQAVVVIRTRLKDSDPEIRRLAAYALSQIDREEAQLASPAWSRRSETRNRASAAG